MSEKKAEPPAPGAPKADQSVHEVKAPASQAAKVESPKPPEGAKPIPGNPAGPLVVGDPKGPGVAHAQGPAPGNPVAATNPDPPGTLNPGAASATAGPNVGAPAPGTGTVSDPEPDWVKHEGRVGAPGDEVPISNIPGPRVGAIPAGGTVYTALKGGKASDDYRRTYEQYATSHPGLVHSLPHPNSPDFNEAAAQALVREKIYGLRPAP